MVNGGLCVIVDGVTLGDTEAVDEGEFTLGVVVVYAEDGVGAGVGAADGPYAAVVPAWATACLFCGNLRHSTRDTENMAKMQIKAKVKPIINFLRVRC